MQYGRIFNIAVANSLVANKQQDVLAFIRSH
jgi:hypothetical protein